MKLFDSIFGTKFPDVQEPVISPLPEPLPPERPGKATKAEIQRIQQAHAAEIEQIRQDAAARAVQVLATEIALARNHIDEAEERANSQLAQAREIERVGTAQFRTWARNYPVPPDGELLLQMAKDGTLVGWFTRYAQWLREIGENPRIPTVSRK